jgi:hypothetical protein
MLVKVVPSTTVDPIELTVNVKVPGPASWTTNWHVPAVVPGVRHDDAGSTVPGPDGATVNVVPFGTAVQSAGAGFATPVCCTVAVNVCGTPVRFVAFAVNSTRYCNHVFDAVTGTCCPGA